MKWIKSEISNPSGNCVEMSLLPDGQVAMRNSRHPRGPVLIFTNDEFSAFLQGVPLGNFNSLVG